jgi:hypothetical protein
VSEEVCRGGGGGCVRVCGVLGVGVWDIKIPLILKVLEVIFFALRKPENVDCPQKKITIISRTLRISGTLILIL